MIRKNTISFNTKINPIVILLCLVGAVIIFAGLFTSKDSNELHQELHFAESFDDVENLLEKDYERNLSEEEFIFMQSNKPNRIGQFTLFEYGKTSYVVMTTPDTKKLKILDVKELPEELREFFLDVGN